MQDSQCGRHGEYAGAGVCARTTLIVGKLPVVRISLDLNGTSVLLQGKGARDVVGIFRPLRLNYRLKEIAAMNKRIIPFFMIASASLYLAAAAGAQQPAANDG